MFIFSNLNVKLPMILRTRPSMFWIRSHQNSYVETIDLTKCITEIICFRCNFLKIFFMCIRVLHESKLVLHYKSCNDGYQRPTETKLYRRGSNRSRNSFDFYDRKWREQKNNLPYDDLVLRWKGFRNFKLCFYATTMKY